MRDHSQIRDSIAVSISACHAEDPGSIPGRGVFGMAGAVANPVELCHQLLLSSLQTNGSCPADSTRRLLRTLELFTFRNVCIGALVWLLTSQSTATSTYKKRALDVV